MADNQSAKFASGGREVVRHPELLPANDTAWQRWSGSWCRVLYETTSRRLMSAELVNRIRNRLIIPFEGISRNSERKKKQCRRRESSAIRFALFKIKRHDCSSPINSVYVWNRRNVKRAVAKSVKF